MMTEEAKPLGDLLRHDLDVPAGANETQRLIHSTIMRVVGHDAYTGGCRAFYTPDQWKARGELYGLNAALVVCHDGGDLPLYFNYDYQADRMIDKMNKALEAIGYYAEPCTSWYTGIYPR